MAKYVYDLSVRLEERQWRYIHRKSRRYKGDLSKAVRATIDADEIREEFARKSGDKK